MEVQWILNTVFGAFFTLVLLAWKNHVADHKRVALLLSKTREDLARDYSTKIEVNGHIDRVLSRLALMDSKIDRILERRTHTTPV